MSKILKTLKENDVVMIELHSSERANVKEICRIFNLKFRPSDEEHPLDWLDFDAEILYTNLKLHKSMLNESLGNCQAITEKIELSQIEQVVRVNDMWKADMYLMSDAELEHKRNLLNSRLGSIGGNLIR